MANPETLSLQLSTLTFRHGKINELKSEKRGVHISLDISSKGVFSVQNFFPSSQEKANTFSKKITDFAFYK